MQGIPADRVKDRMTALDAERLILETRLAGQPDVAPPRLHPSVSEVHHKATADLRETLTTRPDKPEAVERIRALIERIVLHPATDEPSGFLMDIEGDLAGIPNLSLSKKAAGLPPDDLVQIKLFDGTGFDPDRSQRSYRLT